MNTFLGKLSIDHRDIQTYIAYPGGRKVLEPMKEVVKGTSDQFKHSYSVLRDHGNMSSATIIYILSRWMQEPIYDQHLCILSALGTRFISELLLLEWDAA